MGLGLDCSRYVVDVTLPLAVVGTEGLVRRGEGDAAHLVRGRGRVRVGVRDRLRGERDAAHVGRQRCVEGGDEES